jgi:hypothetical protein
MKKKIVEGVARRREYKPRNQTYNLTAITLIMSNSLFSSTFSSGEEGELHHTGTSMIKTFNDFFSGKLSPDATADLDKEAFLSFIIENMYDPINHSVKNEEYPAILRALQKQKIIIPQTVKITVKYSEDYSVSFDKFVGYNLVNELKGPKKLHEYFVQYYQTKKDANDEMSERSNH